jgi:hypothetical protein
LNEKVKLESSSSNKEESLQSKEESIIIIINKKQRDEASDDVESTCTESTKGTVSCYDSDFLDELLFG